MRIYTLLASAMLLSAPAVYAQTANYGYENRFRDNWFVAGAAGVNALNVKVGTPFGLTVICICEPVKSSLRITRLYMSSQD